MVWVGPVTSCSLSAAIVGVVLWYRGRRGPWIDQHPWCRKCKFDLFGTLPQSKTCPECGADVSAKKAVRYGHRRRRPVFTSVGLLLVGLAVLGIAGFVLEMTAGTRWNTHKPLWLLAHETRSSNGDVASDALRELLDRCEGGQLSATDSAWLVDKALDYQADGGLSWKPLWDHVIKDVRGKGLMSDAQWQRFVDHALLWTFTMRRRVESGQPCPYQVRIMDYRLSCTPASCESTDVTCEVWRIGRTGVDSQERLGRIALKASRSSSPETFLAGTDPSDAWVAKLPPGRYRVVGSIVTKWREDHRPTALVTARPQSIQAEIEVVEGPTVRMVTDERLSRVVDMGVTCQPVTFSSRTAAPTTQPALVAEAIVDVAHLPIGLAMQVRVIDGKRELFRWHVVAQRSESQIASSGDVPFDGPVPATVDLILTPDPDAAAKTGDIEEIWGEEMVIRNVPVDDDRARTQPWGLMMPGMTPFPSATSQPASP